MVYFENDLNKKAIEDLTTAIKLAPQTAKYYYTRGLLYQQLKRYTSATTDYSKAITLATSPDEAEIKISCLTERGNIKFFQGNLAESIADFQYLCDAGNEAMCNKVIETNKILARGQNWKFYGTSKSDNTDYYYDFKNISKSKNYLSLWTRVENVDGNYSISQTIVNCSQKKIGISHSYDYSSDGSVLNSFQAQEVEMQPSPPGTVGNQLISVLCKKKR